MRSALQNPILGREVSKAKGPAKPTPTPVAPQTPCLNLGFENELSRGMVEFFLRLGLDDKTLQNLAKSVSAELQTMYFDEVHFEAVEAGQDGYIDPRTGLFVFTSGFLKKRGFCCESGCRHCPFGLSKSP